MMITMPIAQLNHEHFRSFMLAGNARVTLVSQKTGMRFTFKVSVSRKAIPAIYFVSVLTGPDNGQDYEYLGTIKNGVYRHGMKSSIDANAPSAVAFAWAWTYLAKNEQPPQCEVWHEGRCGRCARALTVPSSIALGLGPECAGRV